MASNTPNLNLYKKDPTVDGNDTFNIKTMLNDNWDKIDTAVTTKVDKVDFSSHLADNMYQTATGTATAITLTISGTLVTGYPITFIASVNNNGSATTINNKKLYKSNTTTAPTLIAGKAYTVWYNATGDNGNGCFFIKASAEGNTIDAHVLAGDTYSNDIDTGRQGTMTNRANTKFQICGYEEITEIIPNPSDPNGQGLITGRNAYGRTGYIDSNSQIQMSVAGLVPANIKKGVAIGRAFGSGTQVMIGTMEEDSLGQTRIVGSSHPTVNAPVDLASIRIEFYNRVYPNNLGAIQVLKDGVANVFSGATINVGNTANGTDEDSVYITINESMYPNRDYKVVLPQSCMKDKLGNGFNTLEYLFHTNPNPSVWVNNPAGLNIARDELAGCGTQDAGLSFGGYNGNNPGATEKFNGSTWSSTVNMIYPNYNLAGCGTQNAGLSFGGDGSYTNDCQKFDGSTWSTTGKLITGRTLLAGCGTQNAGLSFGGNGSSVKTEKFDGSTWSTTGNLILGRQSLAGCGTQDAGLSFGGVNGFGSQIATEKFNGSTWSGTSGLNVRRYDLAGCGTQNAGLSFGGNNGGGGSYLKTTEKFNGSTWSTTGDLNVLRTKLAGCGTQSVGLSFGGCISSNNYTQITEKFFG